MGSRPPRAAPRSHPAHQRRISPARLHYRRCAPQPHRLSARRSPPSLRRHLLGARHLLTRCRLALGRALSRLFPALPALVLVPLYPLRHRLHHRRHVARNEPRRQWLPPRNRRHVLSRPRSHPHHDAHVRQSLHGRRNALPDGVRLRPSFRRRPRSLRFSSRLAAAHDLLGPAPGAGHARRRRGNLASSAALSSAWMA